MEKEKRKSTKQTLSKEILLQEGVTATFSDGIISIKGRNGEVKRKLKEHNIKVKIDNNKVILEAERVAKKEKKSIGSLAAHISNMVKGVVQLHTYTLKICAGHFPMTVTVTGNQLNVKNFFGEKVPRVLKLKEGAAVKVEGQHISVTSVSKETAGQVAADIEQLTRRPGFDSRIFQDGIYLVNKDGKELK